MSPLISVVVLTYGERKKELFRCLKSIEKSSYQNKEVILVTNGCPLTLVDAVKSKFPEVKIIQLPTNTGVFFGFNTGFINAKGEYILALDDDTSIRSNTLKQLVELFQASSKDIAVISPNAYNPITKHSYAPCQTKDMISFHGASAFRKSVLDQVGYYDNDFFASLGADDLAIRIINAGYKIKFGQAIIIHHYERGSVLRKRKLFLNARNKAWFNIKHFSGRFLPLLVLRDLVWITLLPYRKKSLKAWWYGITGYLLGYLNLFIPLKKRKPVANNIQKKFIKHYWLGDFKKK